MVYGVPRLHGPRCGQRISGAERRWRWPPWGGGNAASLPVYHIDRGYQSLEGDLRRLGAEIRRI